MVEMEVVYEGDLHARATHGPSRSEVETDAPRDNQGRGERFSPTDLVATALGSCMLTTMGILARRHEWPLEGARATVRKEMVADPVRRIGRLAVHIAMPAGLPAESRGPLERAAHTCPVHRSLHADVKVEVVFDWA